jgi:hypothetical protein
MDDFFQLNWDGSTSTVPVDLTPPAPQPLFDDLFETNWDGSSK